MTDPTPGIAKSVTAAGTTAIGVYIANILDPIIKHAWPWLGTDQVFASIEGLCVAAVVGLATYYVPHSIASQPPKE